MSDQSSNEEIKLYAGKFKTVEELEAGYNNSAKVYQENENLKKKVDEVTKVPDDYATPADIALHEADLAEAKRIAKSSGMNQAQYEKFVREQNAKSLSKHQSFEAAKKEIGADGLNVLQDYVEKYYPEKLRETALKTLITNKEARENALSHRQQLLNNQAPGVSKIAVGSIEVTHDDMIKARDYMMKNKGDMKARQRYLAIQRELAHQKHS